MTSSYCGPSVSTSPTPSVTPPPTPACGAAARQALPPPALPTRPDTDGNRYGLRPRAGPASCLPFGEYAGEHVRDGLLRVRHRCDRAECSTRFLSPPRHE